MLVTKQINSSKTLLLWFALFASMYTFSQDAPDFEMTDVDSANVHLYEVLGQGKPVVLYMFSYYCSSCSDHMPLVDSLYTVYGQGNLAEILAIETSGYNDSMVKQYQISHQVQFPFFSTLSNTEILQLYPISYTPRFYVICPDKTYRDMSFENVSLHLESCISSQQLVEKENQDLHLIYKDGFLHFDKPCSSNSYGEIINVNGSVISKLFIVAGQSKLRIHQTLQHGIYWVWINQKNTKFIY